MIGYFDFDELDCHPNFQVAEQPEIPANSSRWPAEYLAMREAIFSRALPENWHERVNDETRKLFGVVVRPVTKVETERDVTKLAPAKLVTKRRGRPTLGDRAMTNAERVATWRKHRSPAA